MFGETSPAENPPADAQAQSGAGSSPIGVAEVLERHPPKARRGWPKGKPRKPVQAPVSPGATESAVGPEPVPLPATIPPIAKEQILAALRSLIKVVDTTICGKIERAGARLGDQSLAVELRASVEMSEMELETITAMSSIVIDKYGLLGTYAPEILLGMALMGYGYRVHQASSVLRQIAREQAASGLSSQTQPAADNGPVGNG